MLPKVFASPKGLLSAVHSVAHVTRNQRRCQINRRRNRRRADHGSLFTFVLSPLVPLFFLSHVEILFSDSRARFSTVVVLVRLGRRFVARVIVPIPPENPDLLPSSSLFHGAALPPLGHTSAYPFFTHKSRPLSMQRTPDAAGTLALLFRSPLVHFFGTGDRWEIEKYKKSKNNAQYTQLVDATDLARCVRARYLSSLSRETRGTSVSSFEKL